jgi:hypothetical protein
MSLISASGLIPVLNSKHDCILRINYRSYAFPLRLSDVRRGVDAVIARPRAVLLRLLVVVIGAGVSNTDIIHIRDLDIGECRSIAVVGVDA